MKLSIFTQLFNTSYYKYNNYDVLGRLKEQNINDKYKTNYSYITRTYKTSTMIDKIDDNGTEYSYTYDTIGNPLTVGNKTLTWMNGRELA